MSMKNYNVILGIDFLFASHVIVDCYVKRVVFKIPIEAKLTFYGDDFESPPHLISALQA